MTTPTDQIVSTVNRSQEAARTATQAWADAVQGFASRLTSGRSQLPDLQDVVQQYFDFAEKVLADQRAFAQQWASAAASVTGNVTEQVQRTTQSVAAHTADGTEAVVDNAADTARVAAAKAAATARAAGDTATT